MSVKKNVAKSTVAKINQLNSQILLLKNEIKERDHLIHELNESLTNIDGSRKNNEHIQQIDEYKRKLMKKENDLAELKANLSILDKKVNSLFEILEKDYVAKSQIFSKNKDLQKEVYQLLINNKKLNSQIEKIKNHFSYNLGKNLVDTKPNIQDIFSLPKKILGSYKKYYDFKLLNSNRIDDLTFNCSSEKEMVGYSNFFPLRNNIEKTFYNFNDIQEGEVLNISSVASRNGDKNSISCELIVLSGDLNVSNNFLKEKIDLRVGDKHKFVFEINDNENLSLFKFNKLKNDTSFEINWSKKTGKALILKLDKNYKEIENNVVKPLIYNVPDKPHTHVLYKANSIFNDFGKDAALDYFKKFSSQKNKHTLHILNANINHGNEDIWISELNSYLSHYSLPALKLNNLKMDRYFRLENDSFIKEYEHDSKITVIMPAFNSESTILKAVNSILNQSYKNLELIVVNDCSSDSTSLILSQIQDPRLKIINNKKNVGAYVSKNIALTQCTGDYITGHDSDDWAHPLRLENHMKAIMANGYPKASVTKMLRMDKDGLFSHIGKEGSFSADGAVRIASITCMFEREFLMNELGGWDSVRFGADSEIIARAKLILGNDFFTFDQISMICLDAEGSLTNDPVHGVSKVTGISDTRKIYRDSWLAWHESLKSGSMEKKIYFPLENRLFKAPEVMCVDNVSILENLKAS